VLYDLGSGDGRIVIAAAKQFGTRGVGYDIDPDRIREPGGTPDAPESATRSRSSRATSSRPTSRTPPSSRSISCPT
jgi:hypothetical protein